MNVRVAAGAALTACVAAAASAAPPTQIDIQGSLVFPESLSSRSDGTIYIGGQGSKTVYRVAPHASLAVPWIAPGTGGLLAVFGVLADERSRTLWVCSVDRSTPKREGTALLAFDLNSGAPKAAIAYPGGGTCNDVTLAKNGDLYATDTLNGRILLLKHGGNAFSEVVKDAQLLGADGIVFTPDGKLYTNTYGTGLLLRIDLAADGGSATLTPIATSQPLVQPDGMRLTPKGVLLMAEGQGNLDRVDIKDDVATITVLHRGYLVPSAVTVVGDTAWELETKFNYQRDPSLKGQDPGTFHAYAVPIGPSVQRFETRLGSVAFDTTTRALVVGDGRVEVTMDGRLMSVSGTFSGLSAPATAARVFSGALVGVPGTPLFTLTVSPATSGSLSGTVKLTPEQAAALRGERFYVQIDTEQAPNGALWGWLMPSHAIPRPDVPEKGPWFLQ